MARMIVCKECGKLRKHKAHGLCGLCYKRYWYKQNPEYIKNRYKDDPEYRKSWNRKFYRETNRPKHLRDLYGITVTEYDEMLVDQGGVCAICSCSPEENGQRLSVDHDHETGEVRGLLCRSCNLMLGNAKDSIYNLSEAISYLVSAG